MSTHAITTSETVKPMATEWYYRIMNDVIGPLSSRQLLEKVRTGQIKHDTPVRKDDSQWVPASQVSGLMDAAATATRTRRLCPYCGTEVERLPTTCSGCNRRLTVSVNSRLTKDGMSKLVRQRKTRQQQAEELRDETERRELIKYVGLLILWIVLLVITPYMISFVSKGQLVFQGQLAAVAVGVVSAFVGAVYLFIFRIL